MRIGVDLGGTKVEGIALGDDGTELARVRLDTPRAYEATIDAITTLVTRLERDVGQRGSVGIGIPGAVTPATGLVKNANSTWLIGRPLVTDLEVGLARPVRVMNDADCFALSEATDGAGAGSPSVFGVILGTGVGGGVVVNGRPIQGPNLVTGEWGHNPLPWPTADEFEGPPCYCGKRGCIETWLSGPGLLRDYMNSGAPAAADARAIVERAREGQREAQEAMSRYQERLAKALATVVNVLDPYTIVLGGGVSNVPGLAEAVQQRLGAWVFSDAVLTRVVRNSHGDSSGVRGAAWLWPRDDSTAHAG